MGFDHGGHDGDRFLRRTFKVEEAIWDFAGFVLKADSEGRVGPSAHGRTHADAANVIARALRPYGGFLFARAAFDSFVHLDGAFDDNVIVQIKHGPIRFPGSRTCFATVWRTRENEPSHRASDHSRVFRARTPVKALAARI